MNADIAPPLELAALSPEFAPTRPRFKAWLSGLQPNEREEFSRHQVRAAEHLRSTYSINPQLPGWIGWANAMARTSFEESLTPKQEPVVPALDAGPSAEGVHTPARSSAPVNLDLFSS